MFENVGLVPTDGANHHSCGVWCASEYGPTQSASCICIDLIHALCILSTSSAEFPFAARYGLMVSFITATNAITSRNGTYGVERIPSTLFFFKLVCRKAISC